MKRLYKISALLLTVILCFSFVGCGKNEENSEVIIIENDESSDFTDSDGEVLVNITGAMANEIHESENFGQKYRLIIPEWKQLDDYNYEETITNTEEIHITKEITETVTTSESYDFYTRAYKNEESNVYLFVTEYYGSDLYWGAENTFGKTHKATARGISGFVSEKCYKKYIDSNFNGFDRFSFTPFESVKYDCYWCAYETYDGMDYSKGYILTDLDKPFLITVIDASPSRGYDEQVEEIAKQIICSFALTD